MNRQCKSFSNILVLLVAIAFAACSATPLPTVTGSMAYRASPTPTATVTASPTAEVFFTLSPSLSASPQPTVPTANPTTSPKPSPTPTPHPNVTPFLSSQQLVQKLESKYAKDLKNCKPELKSFCARVLYAYDNSKGLGQNGYKIQPYLNRNAIIKYGQTSAGLRTVNFPDGTPAFCFVNTDQNVIAHCQAAIDSLQKSADFLTGLTENGMCIFTRDKNSPEDTGIASTVNEYGVFALLLPDADVKSGLYSLNALLQRCFGQEQFVLAYARLKGGQGNADYYYMELIKDLDTYRCARYVYLKTKDPVYRDLADGSKKDADDIAHGAGHSLADPAFLAEYKMSDSYLLPFGVGSWQEIDALVNKK